MNSRLWYPLFDGSAMVSKYAAQVLHMDLFGPSAVRSYRGNRYTLVIVDEYS
ncbi:hypothetical protein Tco_1179502, partial [Tanacetum coccineum]